LRAQHTEPPDAEPARPGGMAGCVKKTRKRHAVRKMKVGPSEPPCSRAGKSLEEEEPKMKR